MLDKRRVIMLDREILKTDYAVSYGSVTLKSLQNDNVPELDLLVRESIQNSSDAALGENGPCYAVNFATGTFVPSDFNQFLTGIENELNSRFPNDVADYLEIRDTGTSGLTGFVKKSELKSDDHGNFFKLIYDTGKRQTQTNAGGNWGFGKSVYYRVGVGIVIFYSRIKKDNGYESRLIITLTEDEGKKDKNGNDATILGKLEKRSAGKAWWGIRDGEDLLPLYDEETINAVLSVFGLSPFADGQTGTSIIIPYIDSERLLGDIMPADVEISDDVKDHFSDLWAKNIADYLALSIQKWYAPKIHNLVLANLPQKKKWLRVSVNNVNIRKDKMLPFFQLVQELYNTAIFQTSSKTYKSRLFDGIICEPVKVKNYFDDMTTGYIAFVKISKEELNGDQNCLSPYDYIGHYEADGGLNEPIVMFARDPGMVIDYPVDGPWVKRIVCPEEENMFLFGFYMPIVDKKIKDDFGVTEYAGMEFGEYLRKCEASDHMGWNDPAKMQLVSRIQSNVGSIINRKVGPEKPEKVEATASKLANKLGKKLLPRIGYGKKRGGGGGENAGGGGGKVSNITLDYTDIRHAGNRMEMDFTLSLMHSKKDANISILIASEGGGWITPKAWQEDIGTKFPVEIEKFIVKSAAYSSDKPEEELNKICTKDTPSCFSEAASFVIEKAKGSKQYSSVDIKSSRFNLRVSGTLVVFASDKKYQFSIKAD